MQGNLVLERQPPTRIKPYESKKGLKTFNELFFGNLVVFLEARIASSLEKLSRCEIFIQYLSARESSSTGKYEHRLVEYLTG